MYEFLTGPMFIISLVVFFFGMAWRVVWYIRGLNWKLDRVAYKAHFQIGMKGALHSAFKWLVPFGTYSWRSQPFFTVVFFLFHFGAVLVPLFLIGHTEILKINFGFALPAMPQCVSDILTVATIVGALFIALRRIALTEVRILTNWYDWFILALATVPFITGFIARLGVGNNDGWLIAHILTGELMLILAPFTKLSHIVLYFMSRGQIGMDFSIKRGGHSRGPNFPW